MLSKMFRSRKSIAITTVRRIVTSIIDGEVYLCQWNCTLSHYSNHRTLSLPQVFLFILCVNSCVSLDDFGILLCNTSRSLQINLPNLKTDYWDRRQNTAPVHSFLFINRKIHSNEHHPPPTQRSNICNTTKIFLARFSSILLEQSKLRFQNKPAK